MKKFTHWVFDLDGTIIDSSTVYEEAIATVLSEFNIEATPEHIDVVYAI